MKDVMHKGLLLSLCLLGIASVSWGAGPKVAVSPFQTHQWFLKDAKKLQKKRSWKATWECAACKQTQEVTVTSKELRDGGGVLPFMQRKRAEALGENATNCNTCELSPDLAKAKAQQTKELKKLSLAQRRQRAILAMQEVESSLGISMPLPPSWID